MTNNGNKNNLKNNIELTDLLRVQGVNAKGYGIVPKAVMQDRRLTRDAKAIYAYFCSYAGAGSTAFPSVNKICYDLGFKTEDTFRKHMNLLKSYGYIKIYRKRDEKGRWGKNIYTLVTHPEPIQEKVEEVVENTNAYPTPKNSVMDKFHDEDYPTLKYSVMDKFHDGINPTSDNSVSNTNSISNINSICNINNNNNGVVEKIINELKELKCNYNIYSLSDEDINYIINKYKNDLDKLLNIIEYIKNYEPKVGYSNVTGAIISAENWSINGYKVKNNPNKPSKQKNKFHNFKSRTLEYSPEELEDIARRKRKEYYKDVDSKVHKKDCNSDNLKNNYDLLSKYKDTNIEIAILEIKKNISEVSFNTYFDKGINNIDIVDNIALIEVNDSFFKDLIKNKYLNEIKDAFKLIDINTIEFL